MRFALRRVPWRRVTIAAAGGLLVAGVVGASAASLGTVDAEDIGTSTTVIASCQSVTPVVITWGSETFSPTGGSGGLATYLASSISFTLVSSCWNKSYRVTVAAADGTALRSGSGVLPGSGSSQQVALSPAVDLALAKNVTIVIYG